MIRRWLPHPLLSSLLLALWLLLQQSTQPGSILIGLILCVLLGRFYAVLQPPTLRLRHYPVLARLLLRVSGDIVRSNIAVARQLLRRERPARAGFIAIPLTLTERHGLAVLACIITSTPGTIWVRYDAKRSSLLIHVLDMPDEQHWIDWIKQRYEGPLLEIFQ